MPDNAQSQRSSLSRPRYTIECFGLSLTSGETSHANHLLILVAIALLIGTFLTAKAGVKAVEAGAIVLMGRKSSTLVRKGNSPSMFWIAVSLQSLMAAGMFAGSAALPPLQFAQEEGPMSR